jgi:transposase-like protein
MSLMQFRIRCIIYMTNTIASVNMSLRKITKNRESFPSDDALLKLLCLALANISKKWTIPLSSPTPHAGQAFLKKQGHRLVRWANLH